MIEMMKTALNVLRNDKRGVTAIEYALIAGVLVVVIAGAFNALGGKLSSYLGGLSFTDTSYTAPASGT